MTELDREIARASNLTAIFNKIWKPCRKFYWNMEEYNDPNSPISHPDQTHNGKFWAELRDDEQNVLLYEEWEDMMFFDTEIEAIKHMNDKIEKAFKGE